jgi:hypothetical protein
MTGKSYLVQSVVHASEISRAFQSRGEALKIEENRYCLAADVHRRKRYRIGYAALGHDSSFQRAVARRPGFTSEDRWTA